MGRMAVVWNARSSVASSRLAVDEARKFPAEIFEISAEFCNDLTAVHDTYLSVELDVLCAMRRSVRPRYCVSRSLLGLVGSLGDVTSQMRDGELGSCHRRHSDTRYNADDCRANG